MLLPGCVCSGVSILKWQEHSLDAHYAGHFRVAPVVISTVVLTTQIVHYGFDWRVN